MGALLWLVVWMAVTVALTARRASNAAVAGAAIAGPVPVLAYGAWLDASLPPDVEPGANLLVAGVLGGFYAVVVGVGVFLVRRAHRDA